MSGNLYQNYDASRVEELLADYAIKHGAAQGAASYPAEALDEMRAIVPLSLLRLWEREGLRPYLGGRLWLCDPRDFAGVVASVLGNDPDLNPSRTHCFAYTVFGELFLWNEDHWGVDVDLIRGLVSCNGLSHPQRKRNPHIHALTSILTFEAADVDGFDENDKPMFARASKALGAPDYGECYGFVPALALGGAARVENLRKLSAAEHFAILAQAQDFVLRDTLSRPIRDVRVIGAQ